VPSDEAEAARDDGVSLHLSDTHAHLDLADYDADREAVIARAKAAGVRLIVNVGFDLATSRGSIALAREHGFIYASVGVHPHEAAGLTNETIDELRALAADPTVVAIGETGLDYYRDRSPREAQRRAFREQIRLAREIGLPLIVHNRDALDDVLTIIDEEKAGEVGGSMHCFPGDEAYAAAVIDRGFRVGIGGPVTYRSTGRLARVARAVPRNRILLETDAPWLPPQPHRGARNEPAYVAIVADAIARARDIRPVDLARATLGNAMKLFRIPKRPPPSIAYEMWGNLYLNITNRCTNRCSFCLRYESDVLWGYNLKLDHEPDVQDVVDAIGDPTRYREVVFCGYGEPTLRLDVVKEVGRRVRDAGGRVRLDTNGQGSLLWNRNIVPELVDSIDAVSVSVNAESAEAYNALCSPSLGERAYDHVWAFVRESKKAGLDVRVSVVDVPGVDVPAVRRMSEEAGVPLTVRGTGAPRRPGMDPR